MFALKQKDCIFAYVNARVAQLVELQPSKLTVAGSSPVSRSQKAKLLFSFFYFSLCPNISNSTIGIPNKITTVKL